MLQSLADPVAGVPSTAASAGRRPQDSPWDVSDIHCPYRSSAESEHKYHTILYIIYHILSTVHNTPRLMQ